MQMNTSTILAIVACVGAVAVLARGDAKPLPEKQDRAPPATLRADAGSEATWAGQFGSAGSLASTAAAAPVMT